MTDAGRAAVEVAEHFGLTVAEPELIQETNNTVLWLTPGEVIAKVGTHSHSGDELVREHAIGSALADGAPVAPPLPGARPMRHAETGFIVTASSLASSEPGPRWPTTVASALWSPPTGRSCAARLTAC